jgi:hypothetical protein
MIPQHYPIEPDILFGGEYPGDPRPEVALAKLFSLVEMGVRTFIDLTTKADGLAPYEKLLPELELESGARIRLISMPIPDMGVPEAEETMRLIMDAIRTAIAKSPAVYIHCWGGIGRTGTVVGCWLRECGYDPESALERVQHLYSTHMAKARFGRYPEAPQTPEQKNYIRRWSA